MTTDRAWSARDRWQDGDRETADREDAYEDATDEEFAGGELAVRDKLAVGFLSPMQELRFVREAPGPLSEHVDYAVNGAYAMPRSRWRTAHVAYAYTIVPVGLMVCRAIEWALFQRLSRATVALPVLLALVWFLNWVPATGWLIPDQWDISTWFVSDTAGTVELPVDVPVGG